MENSSIMECIDLIYGVLPKLRNALNLTQEEFSIVIGVSRQTVINMEHKEKKLTRLIVISMVAFFSLRYETATILYEQGWYDNTFVINIEFFEDVLFKIHGWSK